MTLQPVAAVAQEDVLFAELLARVRAGDEQAAAALVAQFEGIVRRRARRLLGSSLRMHLDSIDLTQSVNCMLLMGLRSGAFTASTAEELTRLTMTLVRRKVARHWRQRRVESQRRRNFAQGAPAGIAQASANDPAVADQLLLEDAACQILDRLEGIDRRLIELRLAGYTTAEAGRQLGVSPAVLRSRLGRLRKRLGEAGLAAVAAG
ncbi:MAG: RNA polymerase subunit sigma-24 [Planctomycetota bacterium]|nr:MAG: RNA polymerase subunit sigma-24 [Planctomycetota bacterium]